MKKLLMLFAVILMTLSCSIDRMDSVLIGQNGLTTLVSVTTLQPGDICEAGGAEILFGVDLNENGVLDLDEVSSSVSLCNGVDGTDGIDGIDGIDGQDGVSSTIRTEEVEGGYNIYITVGDITEVIFIKNGEDGTNGLDGVDGLNGQDGVDGEDGISSTIRIEQTENGYYLYITTNNQTTVIFISHGQDGVDGTNGTNGIDGIDGAVGETGPAGPKGEDGRTPIFIIDGDTDCPNGGITINIGYDNTNDGIANIDELISSEEVCNGTDGEDGLLLVIKKDYENTTCENGGVTIYMGLDENLNGELDEEEVNEDYTVELCNGMDGIQGPIGPPGENGADGSGTVTICHQNNANDRITLTLTFAEYIEHILTEHVGQSSQSHDYFGECEE